MDRGDKRRLEFSESCSLRILPLYSSRYRLNTRLYPVDAALRVVVKETEEPSNLSSSWRGCISHKTIDTHFVPKFQLNEKIGSFFPIFCLFSYGGVFESSRFF